MERRFRANAPAVASEIIDGEAVIMNLKSGVYFSTRAAGSLLWGWIEQGVPEGTMVQSLLATYDGSPEVVQGAVAGFISELMEHDLIRQLPPTAPSRSLEPDPPTRSGAAFVAPVLDVYDDMQDLLLLDPIHDVDEDAGWPSPKPPEEIVA